MVNLLEMILKAIADIAAKKKETKPQHVKTEDHNDKMLEEYRRLEINLSNYIDLCEKGILKVQAREKGRYTDRSILMYETCIARARTGLQDCQDNIKAIEAKQK